MIDPDLREKIEPNLKIYLPKEDYKYIDEMFRECYLTHEDGFNKITLKSVPYDDLFCLQFLELNGAVCGAAIWDEVKKNGKLL